MKYWKIAIVACLTLYLTACGGGDDSNVIVEEISLTGITLSMSEGVLVGTLAEEQLQITNGPEDLSSLTLALTDDGSEYFSVEIIAGATPGDYLGNLSLVQSLLGLGGSDLNFRATMSVGEQSFSVPVVIHLTELVNTREAYQHQGVYTKGSSRISTTESESSLVIATQPQHGTVEAYFVGNEMWDFNYTSTDCFVGQDSYLYQVAGEYGEVSVNINAALHDFAIEAEADTAKVIDLSTKLPSNFTQNITITQPNNGTSSYNSDTQELTYTPNSSATSDSFTYAANGCSKTISVTVSPPIIVVEEMTLTEVTLSMSEGVLVGAVAEEQLIITNGPEEISAITLALADDDSKYFSVELIAGTTAGDYLGNLSPAQSLLGLAGSALNFTATVSVGEQSLSVPVVINVTEIVNTRTAYQHQDIFTKGNSRISTSESVSGLVIATQPQHGTVEAYFVGNEVWDFNYTSTDCFVGQDNYLYQVAGEYGEVSVNINAALKDLTIEAETDTAKIIDLSVELPLNFTQTITITQPQNGTSSYNSDTQELTYTPNASATTDSFTYAANGCAKTISVTVSRPPLLLALNTAETGQELWKSDGTVAGTFLVKDINLGTDNANPSPFVKRLSDGVHLFFASQSGERGLWKTGGTEESTVKVKDILASYGTAINLTLVGDDVYFTTKTVDTFRVWKSDGTENGTFIVKELPVIGGDRSGYLHTVNGKLLFNYDHPHTSSNPRGEEAWVSDGTALGTVELKDIWPGGGESDFMKGSVIEFKGNLYSEADDGSASGSEVWMTDGTTNGTKLLADLEAGSNGSLSTNFTAADDVFYFTAVTSDKGDQLWKSDGTEGNTVPVKDMDPNSSARDQDLFSTDFFYGHIQQGNDINGLLFFAAKNGDFGVELWKSDGTDAGTVMVKDLMAGVNYSSRPADFVELNNTLYFTAYDIDNSRNLWKSDGTEEGTVMVKSFGPDELQSGGMEVRNGIILLTVGKGGEEGFDYQIWRSDGTETGTYFLGDIL